MLNLLERVTSVLGDRYPIEREIGRGGMATVFLARDLRHDRWVALKVLNPELAATVGSERFHQEVRTVAGLNHPHILPVHDSGSANGFLYYVMPYVEGETLRDRLVREKQLRIDDALRIVTDVASALDHAHAHGIVHRDTKPDNIMLEGDEAIVADFGIARAITTAGGRKLTETGLTVTCAAVAHPFALAFPTIRRVVEDAMQYSLVQADTGRVELIADTLDEKRRDLLPGELAIDGVYQEAWVLAQAGDTARAVERLDRSLEGLDAAGVWLTTEASQSAGLVRAMALRAELAAHSGDRSKARWLAESVIELWRRGGAEVRPLVRRMEALGD